MASPNRRVEVMMREGFPNREEAGMRKMLQAGGPAITILVAGCAAALIAALSM